MADGAIAVLDIFHQLLNLAGRRVQAVVKRIVFDDFADIPLAAFDNGEQPVDASKNSLELTEKVRALRQDFGNILILKRGDLAPRFDMFRMRTLRDVDV